MPNWCENLLTVLHSDQSKLDYFIELWNKRSVLSTLIPIQHNAGRRWCLKNWGITHEITGQKIDDNRIEETCFLTAWNPPLGLYRKLVELGYTVIAYYYEGGRGFCGKYTNENEHEEYSLEGLNSEEIKRQIPEEIDERFSISESIRLAEEDHMIFSESIGFEDPIKFDICKKEKPSIRPKNLPARLLL